MLQTEEVLKDLVERYDVLTKKQAMRLVQRNERNTGNRLKHLCDMGELQSVVCHFHRNERNEQKKAAGATNLYIPKTVRLDEAQRKSPAAWQHQLLTNDFFIAAHEWQDGEVVRFLTEADIKRRKEEFKIEVGKLKQVGVEPDGFVEIDYGDSYYYFLIENERGNYENERIAQKTQKLIWFLEQGVYGKVFHTNDFENYLFFANEGEGHRKKIVRIIRETVKEMGKKEYGEFFKVTSVLPGDTTLFTEPVWYSPGSEAMGLF